MSGRSICPRAFLNIHRLNPLSRWVLKMLPPLKILYFLNTPTNSISPRTPPVPSLMFLTSILPWSTPRRITSSQSILFCSSTIVR
ncbi:hypothetical protein BJX76DRAFT_333590 [Aspergillus varians]